MKKINQIFSLLIGIFLFFSCTEEEFGPVVVANKAPVMADASGVFIFTEDKAAQDFKNFTWTAADYGIPLATSYTLQIDFTGNNFSKAIDLIVTTSLSAKFTYGVLNMKLLAMGAKTNKSTDFDIRVKATVHNKVDAMYSAVSKLNILPYKVVIIYPDLFVAGNYQAASGYTADWSPKDGPRLYSMKSDNKYEGYVYMANAGNMFKFTDGPNWDVNWGDTGGNLSLEPGGADISAPAAGYYKMNVDINKLTYTVLNTTWGLIGSATSGAWSTEQKMAYDKVEKVWKVTLNLTVGEIKFRANDAWELNYGDTGDDGVLDAGGDNIKVVTAGNYTVKLFLEVPGYTYSLTKN